MPKFLGKDSSLKFLDESIFKYQISQSAEIAIFDIGIISCIYILLGITIIINKCKFSHVALDNAPPRPFSLQFKTWTMRFMVLLDFSSAVMAFFVKSYWTAEEPWLGIFYFIPIITLIRNINWLTYQFERKLPLLWYQNQLFWILLTIFYFFELISCYVINTEGQEPRFASPDFFLLIFKVLTSLTLMIYVCLNPQDRADFLADSTGLQTRLISERLKAQKVSMQQGKNKHIRDPGLLRRTSRGNKESFEDRECPLSVTVINKVQKKVDPHTGSIEILYKLHVKSGHSDYKILKTINDFKRLENLLVEEEPLTATRSFVGESLNAVFSDPEAEDMSNVSLIVSTLQNFCNSLVKIGKVSNIYLSFLQVPESDRFKILNWSRKRKDIKSVLELPDSEPSEAANLDRKRLVSVYSEIEEGREHDEEERKEYGDYTEREATLTQDESLGLTKASERDYYPFFGVKILTYKKAPHKKYYEYVINLQLMEKPDEVWEVSKRYSDFVDLKHQLKEKIHVPTPKLPGKFILKSEEEQLEERRKGLESWLRIVLNEKIYFVPELFNFINLNPSYYEWLQDEETMNLSNFKAIIDSNQILMSDNKPYTVYHIIIEQRDETSHGHGRKKRRYAILRRFKEFDRLHHALQTRFCHSETKLPDLPPKYTTFSNKTTVDFRQQGLERYLNELFNYPNIGDSFAFRKFINFKRTMDSFIIFKENSEQLLSSASEPETQTLSNIAIEKTLSTAKSKKTFHE